MQFVVVTVVATVTVSLLYLVMGWTLHLYGCARVLCELVNSNRLLGKACNHYCWLTDCVCGISDHCLVREI